MKNKFYIVFIFFFLINPFFTVFFMLFFTVLYQISDREWLKVCLLLSALLMALIQSTRIIQIGEPSDFISYVSNFEEVKGMDFFHYMQMTYKEPAFKIINYFGYYIFNGDFVLFATLLVFVMYFSVYVAVYKFWNVNFKDPGILVSAIVLFTFMTENFGMTNNIIRHQFAMGLMIYVITQKVVNNKMNWWLAIFACFTHTLMFLFLPILFIKPLYQVIRFKLFLQIVIMLIGCGIIFRYIPFFADLFSFLEFLSYGFNRLEQSTQDERDAAFMIGESVGYYYLVFFLAVVLKLNYWDKPISKSQIFFTNLLVFLLLLCIILNVAPMIQTRLFITTRFLFPFVIPLLFHKNLIINKFYLLGIVLFFYVRFFISFDSIGEGRFFPPILELVTGSIFYFL
jgi:hypothetical protein